MSLVAAICIVGGLFSLAAAILSFIFIIPENKKLNPFFSFLRDLFNFKDLLIEKIFKFLYVLSTAFCIIGGFFMLFLTRSVYHSGYRGSIGYYTSEWIGYYGLLLMVFGPIIVRIVYESIMLTILAVKNIMQINRNVQKITPSADDVVMEPPADNLDDDVVLEPPADIFDDEINV